VRHTTYAEFMRGHPAHLTLILDTSQPIELGDFVSAFTSLANQYEKYIKSVAPEAEERGTIYVAEVKEGSIVAYLLDGIGKLIEGMEGILTLEDFVKRYGGRLGRYVTKGGREPTATKNDLRDFHNALAAIANDPKGSLTLEAAYFEEGERKVKAAFKFNTQQARQAEREIENHKQEIEGASSADHERVLMTFVRSDIRTTEPGRRSGELVMIEALGPKPRPLIYASALAEERIKFEIRDDESVYKKGFVVDVNVETKNGNPIAYRVTNLHQVIDLPDDEG